MKTIRETVASGISTLQELEEALQTAIQLEFSTIPPYLCAEWSINPNQDPSGVTAMVHGVVIQEMLHFGFASNMLSAIGGSPSINNTTFVPTYPTLGLPGNVQPGLVVNLLPLGPQALNTFMQIEFPEVGIVAPDPGSIGAFYDTISAGFTTVNPTISTTANQVVTKVDSDQLTAIASVPDAIAAINEVKDQGEGSSQSPEEGTLDPNELAHYYTFGQIYFGNALVQDGSSFEYTGSPITMPAVFSFQPSSAQPATQALFIETFSNLLDQLQACWATGASIGTAVGTMGKLAGYGKTLIQAGVQPQFTYAGAGAAKFASA